MAFSPFYGNLLACATASNYGIIGNGRLYILEQTPTGHIKVKQQFDTQDGLFDVAFVENHDHQCVTASGDGSIKLWDFTLPVSVVFVLN